MITTANLAALFLGALAGWLAGIVVGLTIARAMRTETPRDRLVLQRGWGTAMDSTASHEAKADQLLREAAMTEANGHKAAALAAYREVVRLYPETKAAAVARSATGGGNPMIF